MIKKDTAVGREERSGIPLSGRQNVVSLVDRALEEHLITVKLPLFFTLLTQCNSISPTAGFTFNFTAELSHVP